MPSLDRCATYSQMWTPVVRADGTWYMVYNAGHCPGDSLSPLPVGVVGSAPGECAMLEDGSHNPPTVRRIRCTSSDTTDEWERGFAVLAPHYTGTQAGVPQVEYQGISGHTLRLGGYPANQARPILLDKVVMSSLTDPFPYIHRGLWAEQDVQVYPYGWVYRHGQRYVYAGRVPIDPATGNWLTYELMRFIWLDSGELFADWSGLPYAVVPPWTPIEVGEETSQLSQVCGTVDGALWAMESDFNATDAMIWRSTDEGRTWSMTASGIHVPDGYAAIWDCHMAVDEAGVAVEPRWGICQATKSMDWSTAGQWQPFLWRETGAHVPASFTAQPVWTPQ